MDKIEELFHRCNPWWGGKFALRGIVVRKAILEKLIKAFESKSIVLLTGLRRIGKTTLLRLLIQDLIREKKIPPEKIFYISMDHYSLRGMTLDDIIDKYRALHKLKSTEQIYLFLDEITSLVDYEQQLKNVYDMEGVKIYASSSSASLLRKGKAYITGRNIVIEVPPLDFEEYLQFKKITISPMDSHLKKVYFEDFMHRGGIPEFVLSGDVTYIHQLVDDIICKDIAAVHGVKDLGLLKDFFMLLMERAGKSVSINKLANILDISPDTARRYLDYFEDTYLIHLISRHGKVNERLRAPKKLYAADIGLRVQFTGYRDIGSLFENYVYLKIASKEPQFVLQDGIEIDFYTKDKCLIEVKYYSELREKQKKMFDEYQSKDKLIIGSVDDLKVLNDDSVEFEYSLKESSAIYGTKKNYINLGRSPGLEV